VSLIGQTSLLISYYVYGENACASFKCNIIEF
jgi:hypothetical protein